MGLADIQAFFEANGIDKLTAVLEGCPDSTPRATVLTSTGVKQPTVGCGFSKYFNVPADPVLRYEWHYVQTDAYAPVGGVVPMAQPIPYNYSSEAPVLETSRELGHTAWEPVLNEGITCSHYSSPNPTACWLGKLRLQLAPGWEDYQGRMSAMGATSGRITLAHQCPQDAVGRTTSMVFASSFRSSHQIGCAWNNYYTIPSEYVSWRFEWYIPSRGGWVDGGGQRNAEETVDDRYLDVDLDEYAAAIAAGTTLARVCEPMLFVPSTSQLSSVPKEYQACTALVSSNKYTLRQIVAMMTNLFGPTVLDVLAGPDRLSPSAPRIYAPTVRHPRSSPNAILDTVPPVSGNVPIVRAIEQAHPEMDNGEANSIATRCRQLVQEARLASVPDDHGTLRSPCEVLPIYVPGTDAGAAAVHKLNSILAFPDRVNLHNSSAAVAQARLFAGGYMVAGYDLWRPKVPYDSDAYTSVGGAACLPQSIGFECDEYPYAASQEGGPRGDPTDPSKWTGFTLSLVPQGDNQVDGNGYRAFKLDPACGLTNPSPPGHAREGVSFLVIPMPGLSATTHICEN